MWWRWWWSSSSTTSTSSSTEHISIKHQHHQTRRHHHCRRHCLSCLLTIIIILITTMPAFFFVPAAMFKSTKVFTNILWNKQHWTHDTTQHHLFVHSTIHTERSKQKHFLCVLPSPSTFVSAILQLRSSSSSSLDTATSYAAGQWTWL